MTFHEQIRADALDAWAERDRELAAEDAATERAHLEHYNTRHRVRLLAALEVDELPAGLAVDTYTINGRDGAASRTAIAGVQLECRGDSKPWRALITCPLCGTEARTLDGITTLAALGAVIAAPSRRTLERHELDDGRTCDGRTISDPPRPRYITHRFMAFEVQTDSDRERDPRRAVALAEVLNRMDADGYTPTIYPFAHGDLMIVGFDWRASTRPHDEDAF